MISITISKHKQGGELISEQSIDMATEWKDVTLGQFIEIIKEKAMTEIKLLSILTGKSEEFITGVPAKSLKEAVKHIFFLNEKVDFSRWKVPKEIEINNKFYRIPKIKEETFGQKVLMQQEYNKAVSDDVSIYDPMPYALAVYFYPIVSGDKKYTDEAIRAFIPTILNTKACEAIPTADFFLQSYVRSLPMKERIYTSNLLKKRLRQELTGSKSLVS